MIVDLSQFGRGTLKTTRSNTLLTKKHPLVERILASDEATDIRTALQLIEQNFPVSDFSNDAASERDQIYQGAFSRNEINRLLEHTIPNLMAAEGQGTLAGTIEILKRTEPFNKHWSVVEEYLDKKGWQI